MFQPTFICDAHAHVMTPARIRGGIRWMKRAYPDYFLSEETTEEDILKEMQLAGVRAFFNYFYPLKPGESKELNAWQRDFARREPRAIPFASLHAGDPEKKEIIRQALDEEGLYGFKFHPYVQGFHLSDPALEEVYGELAQRSCPVIFHTGFAEFYGLPPVRDELRMVLERFPRLTVVAAHMVFPDIPFSEIFGWLDKYPCLYLDATNVFANLAGPNSKEGEELVRSLEKHSNRVVFGSDYPMGYAPLAATYRQALKYCATPEVAEDIFWRTVLNIIRGYKRDFNFTFF